MRTPASTKCICAKLSHSGAHATSSSEGTGQEIMGGEGKGSVSFSAGSLTLFTGLGVVSYEAW